MRRWTRIQTRDIKGEIGEKRLGMTLTWIPAFDLDWGLEVGVNLLKRIPLLLPPGSPVTLAG